jgi:hypothetical protein
LVRPVCGRELRRSNGSLNIPGNNFYDGLTEFIGGVQAGYNIQSGHLLFGVEGEFDGLSIILRFYAQPLVL